MSRTEMELRMETLRGEHTDAQKQDRELQDGTTYGQNTNTAYVERQMETLANQMIAADREAENAAWTREITVANRMKWNTMAKAGRVDRIGMEKEAGFTMDALVRQVRRYAL